MRNRRSSATGCYDTAGTFAQYNGNIASQQWGSGSTFPNRFNYQYDKLNRLTNGTSTGLIMSEAVSYDVMGNIAKLTRTGSSESTYSYTGNKLNSISGGLNTGTYF